LRHSIPQLKIRIVGNGPEHKRLEAMAAGKPIVAVRAAAVPEVALGTVQLYRNPGLRPSVGSAGHQDVENFDAPPVACLFLLRIAKVVPTMEMGLSDRPMASILDSSEVLSGR